MSPTRTMLGALVALALVGGAAMADRTLFDFEGGFDFAAVEARSVAVSPATVGDGTALRMDTRHDQDWPGITLPAPGGKWDLSPFARVEVDVRNAGTNQASVSLRVDNPGADGARHCVQVGITLEPGASGTIAADMPHPLLDADGKPIKLFGMRAFPGGANAASDFDPGNVTQLLVFVAKPSEDHSFEVDNIRAVGESGTPLELTGSFFPFIDQYGQYIHRDWPGKTHGPEDIEAHRQAEEEDLAARPGPEGWDKWGGWEAGPTLAATGFFRAEKRDGKWWLVDPDGKLFFSHGIDCVGAWGDDTPLDDRDGWFAGLPDPSGEFADCYGQGSAIHDYYKGRTMRTFDHGVANLRRKYGPAFLDRFTDVSHRRLRSWGMNTIANWSDSRVYEARRTPYVTTVWFGGKPLAGSEGYWGQFRDVFDPSFEEAIRQAMAGQVGRGVGDPWCLGFYVDNEIAWGDEVSLALAALASPKEQVAKQVFIEDLRAKYGEVAKLNEGWGTAYASWEALLETRELPDRVKARDDLVAFYTKTAERYFSVIRAAVKEAAPGQLYLGCRFAWVNDFAVRAAAKYCDVVSYNLYVPSVASFRIPEGLDVPLMIGEFHFGALDRGMFHTGLVPVKDQAARAKAYQDYVRGCLRHPLFVGCHWFKYRDESTTGRPLDAENYQIGFVDIVDTPYAETIEACRKVGYGMYEYRAKP
jgi:hypothetical protein